MSTAAIGLLVLDKPAGISSYDCVRVVKRRFNITRVGHCGTLDPLAKGVLLVLLGTATRFQERFLELEKEYRFSAEFGKKTDTGDLAGSVVMEKPYDHIRVEALASAMQGMVGPIEQTPPAYAALKYKGKPYYKYARQGIEIPRVPRRVTVHQLSLLSAALPSWEGRLVCSRGTYVRTLVEDIGEKLGSVAVMTDLSRERIGPYTRAMALTWDRLKELPEEELLQLLVPVATIEMKSDHEK